MNPSKKIPEIKEEAEELYRMFKKEKNVLMRDRLHLLYKLKTEKIISIQKLAEELGRECKTIYNWLSYYKKKGLEGYLSIKQEYRKSSLDGEIAESLKEKLSTEEGFSSYIEIEDWLKKEYNVKMTYSGIYKYVKYILKAKLKVVRPVNIKKDPKREEEFKKNY